MDQRMTPTCVYSWVKTVKSKHHLLLICRMQQRASIGEKFFESSKHSGDLKKMKKRLGETADFHMKYYSGNRISRVPICSNIFSEMILIFLLIKDIDFMKYRFFR